MGRNPTGEGGENMSPWRQLEAAEILTTITDRRLGEARGRSLENHNPGRL